MDSQIRQTFLNILKEELVPAMGCTEPIALAYAAAKAREILGCPPDVIQAECSGNMIKNVRCVQIPHSNGMHGIEAALALGALGGDVSREMEVLETVTAKDILKAQDMIRAGQCDVSFLESEIPLHFIITERSGSEAVTIEVRYSHMNIVRIEKNGQVLLNQLSEGEEPVQADRSLLSMDSIKEFADSIELEAIRPMTDLQIRYNMQIAEEGMSGRYGLGIGGAILEQSGEGVIAQMKAFAAAGSEARMDGCDLPVIINSGSGNQGIASSVPVIIYARMNRIPEEKLHRALIFSALLTIYQKKFIGRLSAFCGAVSASCASAAAVTYLCGGTMQQIKATIDNTLANIPGIICDGAKISCASKIATCVDAAMMAHSLAMKHKAYEAFTGILREEAGETISCVGYIGRYGMEQTDKEIVKLMLQE
ncbi:MAG: serine dehydratase subunit alpha family protein [Firmicutes bacterium]|nr:serine dehydratase subunit alpha family protein [Bacillota bacterium]